MKTLLFSSALLVLLLNFDTVQTQTPIVMWHGMGKQNLQFINVLMDFDRSE